MEIVEPPQLLPPATQESEQLSAAPVLLDLLQIDLLAGGASLSGREAADRERRSRDRSTCLA